MKNVDRAWAAGKKIVARLQEAGFTAYFAGGCVRDLLLNRPAKDIDIATSARPEDVQRLFARTTGLEGKCFGVIRVLEDGEVFEVATFREDVGYEDGRRPTSVRFSTAAADALRRDFTINGLFYDPVREEVIDFVGGSKDLQNRQIRAIGDPRARFEEDHLRLLRAVRLATNLHFQIEPITWQAIRELAPKIRRIAPERIREELDRIWTGPDPARGLTLLDESRLLGEILPELSALHGVEQPPQYHPEGDVFEHVRRMLTHLRYAPLELTLSCLFHDIAKPVTARRDATGRIRFHEHETIGARMTEEILRRLRYKSETIQIVCDVVANHMTFKDVPRMRLSTLKRLMARATFELELELHKIDCLSSHGDLSIYQFLLQKRQELSHEEIEPPRLVTGWDLQALGIPPGPRLGKILAEIREAQLEGKVQDRAQALALAEELAKQERTSPGQE
jgi:tRNA nucleotidyltransferase/poly(A) polymerase